MIRLLALLTLIACVHALPAQEAARSAAEQAAATVAVRSVCEGVGEDAADDDFRGRGVIVTSRHIVTAAHVVECHTIPDVEVYLPGGAFYRVVVTAVDELDDLALLELASAGHIAPATAVLTADVEHSETVCFAGRCGAISRIDQRTFDFAVDNRRGLSGIGVYDLAGALVGFVSGIPDCGHAHCGSRAVRAVGHMFTRGRR